MKHITTKLYVTTVLLLGAGSPVSAQSTKDIVCQNNPQASQCQGADLGGAFGSVTDTLLIIIGAAAVIMLIIGGFRYVVSGGDPKALEGAKNTILYAIIGIVVAFLAYAAVNFLVGEIV